jgi:hypothetical protein
LSHRLCRHFLPEIYTILPSFSMGMASSLDVISVRILA